MVTKKTLKAALHETNVKLAEKNARIIELEGMRAQALFELGVPDDNYPAPVANAVKILRNGGAGWPVSPLNRKESGLS